MTNSNSTKLNQIIAVEKGVKSRVERSLTDIYHTLQKSAAMNGLSRTYHPDHEDGEKLPDEKTLVQVRASELIRKAQETLSDLLNITMTKDLANCSAKANIVVDDVVLVENVPATTLIFLEKHALVHLHTFISKIPVLDPSEAWKFDQTADCYTTEPSFVNRNKKVMRAFKKAEATDKFPAQVETFNEDVCVGQYKTVKFSGALQQREITLMLERVEKLQRAVKFAREEANSIPVVEKKISKEIFGYLFGSN